MLEGEIEEGRMMNEVIRYPEDPVSSSLSILAFVFPFNPSLRLSFQS